MSLNTLGSIASIIGLIIAVLSCFLGNTGVSFWNIALVGITCIPMGIFLYQGNTSNKYAQGFREIQSIHKDVLKHYNDYKGKDLKDSTQNLSQVCLKVSQAFDTMRDIRTSVCIKYINRDGDKYYVKTLCRDSISMNDREEIDDDARGMDAINDNTDFRYIFEKYKETKKWDGVYYFSNYLPLKHQYSNTHLDTSKISDNRFSFLTRSWNWPLPYKSTIVVPIISNVDGALYGFLCIDSPKNKGFDEKRDVDILQNVALFLGATIKLISEQSLKQ